MNSNAIFLSEEFIDTVVGLQKKKSYKNCEAALIEGVFKVSREELFDSCSANRLDVGFWRLALADWLLAFG